MHQSTINVLIDLDEQKIPQNIKWSASDSTANETQEARAMMLTLWDPTDKTALRIDLWTKDMQVEEMKFFVHQTLLTLSDSFEKATGDARMSATMRDFCDYYAEKMNINPPL